MFINERVVRAKGFLAGRHSFHVGLSIILGAATLVAIILHAIEAALANHWQLMGALEALNGMILFGLTTAFLYGMIRELLAVRRES